MLLVQLPGSKTTSIMISPQNSCAGLMCLRRGGCVCVCVCVTHVCVTHVPTEEKQLTQGCVCVCVCVYRGKALNTGVCVCVCVQRKST